MPFFWQPVSWWILRQLARWKVNIHWYSRVPNKRIGHLLENGKKSHLYTLIRNHTFIPTYTFINFLHFYCQIYRKRIFFFQTPIIIHNGSQGEPSTWIYDQNSFRIHENFCFYWFSLTKSLQEFPPIRLLRPRGRSQTMFTRRGR